MRRYKNSLKGSPLRRYLIISVIIHLALVSLITVGIIKGRHKVEVQEDLFVADILDEQKRLEEDEELARKEAVKDLLSEQVMADMEQIIDDQLDDQYEEELLNLTEDMIEERLDEFDAAMELDSLLNDEFYELTETLRADAFEDIRSNLEQMKQDLLLSQVRSFIRDHVAPEIKQKIDEQLKHELGERIKSQAVQPEIRTLSRKIASASDNNESGDMEHRVVESAVEDIEVAVRKEIEKEVTETAIPAATERITRALNSELKKRKLDDAKFKKFLDKDIRRALEEEMNRQNPDSKLALLRTKQQFDIQDKTTVEEAREKVAEAARKLNELADRQEDFRDEVPEDTPSRDALKQRSLATDITTARKQAAQSLKTARKVTIMHDAHISKIEKQAKNSNVEKTAVDAAKAMEREVVSDARQMMEEVVQDLRTSADAMGQLEQTLAKKVNSMPEQKVFDSDLNEIAENKDADKAVANIIKKADKVIKQHVKKEVKKAVRSVNMEAVLGSDEGVKALAKMSELENQLGQIAENMEAGRSLEDSLGMGLLGVGHGIRPGTIPSIEVVPWALPYGRRMTQINLRAYEEFVKDMRDRLNPDNYYTDEGVVDEIVSKADTPIELPPAVIFLDELPVVKDVVADKNREVPKPGFKTIAFGAAGMMEKRPVIDGDLSDWGELRHGLELRYTLASLAKVETGPTVYVRWSPDGIYFGYTVKDSNGIQACPKVSWDGDGLEVMIDSANSRRPDAYLNTDSQKFELTPFGCRGNKKLTLWEMGRGLRGLKMAQSYPDKDGVKGKSEAKQHNGGYTVEAFISRRALAKPVLVPGKYVGLNFSLNRGRGIPGYQWSASQKIQTWRHPDTWGDLLLLGSDAKLIFTTSLDSDEVCNGIVPDGVIYIKIDDADMNINTRKVDRIPAKLTVKKGGASLFVVLAETGANTGVFRASVDTQSYFMEPKENTLNVKSGNNLELIYTDARSEYGEKNRKIITELVVGWPVMRLNSKK